MYVGLWQTCAHVHVASTLLFPCAAENVQLTAELARYQAYVDRNERESLLTDVDGLRAEVLRLQETVERLSAAPQVGRDAERFAAGAVWSGWR